MAYANTIVKQGEMLALVLLIVLAALFRHESFLEIARFAMVLTVAAIPVALPAVLSVTMAVGAMNLARRQAIARESGIRLPHHPHWLAARPVDMGLCAGLVSDREHSKDLGLPPAAPTARRLIRARGDPAQGLVMAARIPCNRTTGAGGQPGILTSTGSTFSTAPQLA